MSARKLLGDFAHALRVFLDVEEDEDGALAVDAWDRTAFFQLDTFATGIWKGLPCEEQPPHAYLLMRRVVDDKTIHELLWALDDTDEATWPVVELTSDGDAQILACSAEDYVDALIFTAGALGGGSEDDLVDAREDAVPDALELAGELADELDRDEADPEVLGDRWDDAVDAFGDTWTDAVEGIDV